jgi:hypothetical protein
VALPPRRPVKPQGPTVPSAAKPGVPSRKPGIKGPALKPPSSAGAQPASPPATCTKCNAALEPGIAFCGECGAPVKRGVKPKRSMAEVRRNLERGKNLRQVNEARKVLLWVGVANMVIGLLLFLFMYAGLHQASSLRDHGAVENNPEFQSLYYRLILIIVVVGCELPGIIFFGLYVWAKTSPLPATIAGLITYLTFMIASIALNPQLALSVIGWLIRIAIIGALAKGIQSAAYEKKMREKQRKREAAASAAAQEDGDSEAEPQVE